MALAALTGSSALSERDGDQELADACLDVFAQQIFEAPSLLFFHKQRTDSVRILTGTMAELEDGGLSIPWHEIAPWSFVCYSVGFDTASDNVGGAIEGLELATLAFFPEPAYFRRQGQLGLAGLDQKLRIALSGGRDSDGTLNQGNENLTWRAAWTAPPAGFKGGVEPSGGSAAHGMKRGPLLTRHGQVTVAIDGSSCMMSVIEFSTVYGVVRSTC